MYLLDCMAKIIGFALNVGKLDAESLVGLLEMCDSAA